jgi:hypothetical protein
MFMSIKTKTLKISRVMGRWSSSPELLQKIAIQTPKEVIVIDIPDLTKLPYGRRLDLIPGRKEPICIAVKFDGEEECYIFSNESYLVAPSPHTRWRYPPWKLGKGIYYIVITIVSGNIQKKKKICFKEFRFTKGGFDSR